MAISYHYVDSDSELRRVVGILRSGPVVSIDTEFARSHTYYPEVGLIQAYDGRQCYLIDPLAVGDLAIIAELLADTDVTKVLHACSEDMEVFEYAVGVTPSPVFDTQIAAAALGISFSISYQNLVAHYLDISVPKEQTRSDWLQRPLSDAQLDYAALDVIHLLEVYDKQERELESQGRSHWVEEECSGLGQEISISLAPDRYYLRVKSSSRMSRAELNKLQALCAWRERRARELNVPRNRVVEEKALVAAVRSDIHDKNGLQEIAGMTPRQVRKHGDEILFLLSEARLVPARDFPAAIEEMPVAVKNARMKLLKKVVDERAAALNVSPELLARRRHLELLLRTADEVGEYELPDPFTGWRRKAIGEALLAALQDG